MSDTPACTHSEPDYQGRCTHCGTRLEAPSRALIDAAAKMDGHIVTLTKKYRIPPGTSYFTEADVDRLRKKAAAMRLGGWAADYWEWMDGIADRIELMLSAPRNF